MHVTRAVITAAALACADIPADADQIAYSQPPAPPGAIASGSNHNWLQFADDFTLAGATGQPVSIAELSWWGGNFHAEPPATESFRLRFYTSSSASSVPQSLLTTIDAPAAVLSINPAGFASSDADAMYLYKVDLRGAALVLPAQTRLWLNLTRPSGGGFVWYASDNGNAASASMNPSPGFFQPWTPASRDFAFEIVAVPAPTTLSIAAIIATLNVRRRRRLTSPAVV